MNALWNFHRQVTERISAVPGIQSVALARGVSFTGNGGFARIILPDRARPERGQEPQVLFNTATANYFSNEDLMMRRTLYSMILVSVFAFFPHHLGGQGAQDRFKTQLQPIIEQVMEQRSIPGFAIAVVHNQKVVYAAGLGVRNLENKSDKVTPQSLFHMASITKPFVATSVMQLVEKGKVDLNAPVVKYLPYFRLKDERYATITVRQMLSHLSGMPDVRDYEWDKPQYDDGALERYVRSLSNQ